LNTVKYLQKPASRDDLVYVSLYICKIVFTPGAFSQSSWPRNGRIQFIGVSLQYEKTGQTALKNISCIIEAKEKV